MTQHMQALSGAACATRVQKFIITPREVLDSLVFKVGGGFSQGSFKLFEGREENGSETLFFVITLVIKIRSQRILVFMIW